MLTLEILLRLLAGAFLVGANAFFVATEFALTRLRQFSEEEIRDDSALRTAWRMTERLEIHLTGCQLGISVTSILLGVVAEPAVSELLAVPARALGVPEGTVPVLSVVTAVIAINLMAKLLHEEYATHYATGSRAFTQTLRKIIGSRGSSMFKYFNSYLDADENEIDVLIADEAHRIREVSHSRWTPKEKRTDEPQIEELIRAAKVGVYLIDDRQIVRPTEIGSADLILEHAEENDCRIFEYELEAQFRCAGSEGFVNWIDNTLQIARTANVIWDGTEDFDFRIMPSPMAVEEAIREKADEGHSARMVAGFCWKWSDPNPDGTLVDDVVIEPTDARELPSRPTEYRRLVAEPTRDFVYARPWNAKPGKRTAEGIPPSHFWATDPGGIDQIGCIYTAQGFEFDYAGVIFGPDLRYDFDLGRWVGHPESSHDTMVKRGKEQFVDLVKNTYRVLLSRGLKGCYVYFMDNETERFVRSRMAVS